MRTNLSLVDGTRPRTSLLDNESCERRHCVAAECTRGIFEPLGDGRELGYLELDAFSHSERHLRQPPFDWTWRSAKTPVCTLESPLRFVRRWAEEPRPLAEPSEHNLSSRFCNSTVSDLKHRETLCRKRRTRRFRPSLFGTSVSSAAGGGRFRSRAGREVRRPLSRNLQVWLRS